MNTNKEVSNSLDVIREGSTEEQLLGTQTMNRRFSGGWCKEAAIKRLKKSTNK